eukprot:gene34375-46107_t
MKLPGGCGALNNDSSSQQAIMTATAKSLNIHITYVEYTGCSSLQRRNLNLVSAEGLDHLLGGSGPSTVQSVSANTEITLPLSQNNSAAAANALYATLKSQFAVALSSGNFTRSLKVASVSLGAQVTANVNTTSLGSTSGLVLTSPAPNSTNPSAPTTKPLNKTTSLQVRPLVNKPFDVENAVDSTSRADEDVTYDKLFAPRQEGTLGTQTSPARSKDIEESVRSPTSLVVSDFEQNAQRV